MDECPTFLVVFSAKYHTTFHSAEQLSRYFNEDFQRSQVKNQTSLDLYSGLKSFERSLQINRYHSRIFTKPKADYCLSIIARVNISGKNIELDALLILRQH